MWPNLQIPVDLVTITEEILNGKLHFSCSGSKLSLCNKTKTFSCISKRKLKLCICIWAPMTWPWNSESTFSTKNPSCKSWKIAQLSKMLCNSVLLTTIWAQCSVTRVFCSNLLPFLESIWFFSVIFKP